MIQAIDPWISSRNIDGGALWFSEISDQLADTTLGIVCLTHENKAEPWLLFEAGALAKGLTSSRVCTFLIDLESSDISNPLAQLNHSSPSEEGVLKLIEKINNSLGEKSLKESTLQKVFDRNWPEFKKRFDEEKISIPFPQQDVNIFKADS